MVQVLDRLLPTGVLGAPIPQPRIRVNLRESSFHQAIRNDAPFFGVNGIRSPLSIDADAQGRDYGPASGRGQADESAETNQISRQKAQSAQKDPYSCVFWKAPSEAWRFL
jgi:hypothetical protein